MEDLTSHFLNGCSPYICQLTYNPTLREVVLEVASDPESMSPCVKVIFGSVASLSDENDHPEENDCIDSVIGMHWMERGLFCLRTQQREMIMELQEEPRIERPS